MRSHATGQLQFSRLSFFVAFVVGGGGGMAHLLGSCWDGAAAEVGSQPHAVEEACASISFAIQHWAPEPPKALLKSRFLDSLQLVPASEALNQRQAHGGVN